jgi:hypothetical protein
MLAGPNTASSSSTFCSKLNLSFVRPISHKSYPSSTRTN